MRSERISPLTNMQYNQQVEDDNTLEKLAVPSLEHLPLEKESPQKFAQALQQLLHEKAHQSNRPPKDFFFAMFLVLRFIKA